MDLVQEEVNRKPVIAHIYKYTTQSKLLVANVVLLKIEYLSNSIILDDLLKLLRS